MPRSSKCHSFRFSRRKSVWILFSPQYVTCPTDLIFLDILIAMVIWRAVKVIQILLQFSPAFCYFLPIRAKHLPYQTIPSAYFSPEV